MDLDRRKAARPPGVLDLFQHAFADGSRIPVKHCLWLISADGMVSIDSSSISRHEIVRDGGWLRSVITNHRKEELFHPGSALDLGARQGARHRGDVTG